MTILNQNKYLWKYSYTEFYFTAQDLYNPPHTPCKKQNYILNYCTFLNWAILVLPISFLKLSRGCLVLYRKEHGFWDLIHLGSNSYCTISYFWPFSKLLNCLEPQFSHTKWGYHPIPFMVMVTYKVNEYIGLAQFLGYRWCPINGSWCLMNACYELFLKFMFLKNVYCSSYNPERGKWRSDYWCNTK